MWFSVVITCLLVALATNIKLKRSWNPLTLSLFFFASKQIATKMGMSLEAGTSEFWPIDEISEVMLGACCNRCLCSWLKLKSVSERGSAMLTGP